MAGAARQCAAFQVIKGQAPIPHAAGVECNRIGVAGQSGKCGPVPEQDFFRDVDPAWPDVPGMQMGRYRGEGFLVLQVDVTTVVQG